MQVAVRESAGAAAALAARLVLDAIGGRANPVLGFATGRTMVPVYAEFGRLHREGALDASSWRSFNLDEYVGLHADDARCYRVFMRQHLARVVNIDERRMHLPAGDAADPEAEAARFERRIVQAGGIDVQLLGIGDNGHIGFNEPGTKFDARTRVVTLTADTRRQNAAMFAGADAVPTRAITMGIGTILRARRIVLLATGTAKAEALRRAIEEEPTDAMPASALQSHSNCVVVADVAAFKKARGSAPGPR